jgi:hypothetical protein
VLKISRTSQGDEIVDDHMIRCLESVHIHLVNHSQCRMEQKVVGGNSITHALVVGVQKINTSLVQADR